eukprot:774644_1
MDNNNALVGQNNDSVDDSSDNRQSCWMKFSTFNWITSPKFLIVNGIIISCCLFIEGILCFFYCSVNMRSYVLSFYYMVFSLFTIGLELKFQHKRMYDHFDILSGSVGKGLWYLFLASLSFGSEWWAMLTAVLLIWNGMLNSYVGCAPNVAIGKKEMEGIDYIQKRTEEECDLDDSDDDVENVNVELGKLEENKKEAQIYGQDSVASEN